MKPKQAQVKRAIVQAIQERIRNGGRLVRGVFGDSIHTFCALTALPTDIETRNKRGPVETARRFLKITNLQAWSIVRGFDNYARSYGTYNKSPYYKIGYEIAKKFGVK